MIKVFINPDNCIGAGHCVRIAPSVFDQQEIDGIVVLLMAEVPDEFAAELEKAQRLCPAQAIFIETN